MRHDAMNAAGEVARKRTPRMLLAAAVATALATVFAVVGSSASAQTAASPLGSDMRGVTYVDFGPPGFRVGDTTCYRWNADRTQCDETRGEKLNEDLAAALPKIRASGFNTVRLITEWQTFD